MAKNKRSPSRKTGRATRSTSRSSRKKTGPRSNTYLLWIKIVLIVVLLAAAATFVLDTMVRERFDGKRWALPAKIYARPLELYPGLSLSATALEKELIRLRYRHDTQVKEPGSYHRNGYRLQFYSRDFQFLDGLEPQQKVEVTFVGGEVHRIRNLLPKSNDRNNLDLLRLEPMEIGGFYPTHNEDRTLISLDQVPPLFIETLLTVEDRDFFEHKGISWRGIARAMWANVKAGHIAQGGSSLTQQLVKNLYLNDQRSYLRKAVEAVMALLLEYRYDKSEILEAYLNEIYLGQNGDKSINGLGLASAYYFGRSVEQLKLEQIALLVGIIKGPSYYDPRRFPERALNRRNQVLDMLKEQGVISDERHQWARKQALNIVSKPYSNSPYPAYIDLVKRQLRRDYNEKDLRNEGLRIFTTLNPALQEHAENAVISKVKTLENAYKMPANSLQSAVMITSADGGEVLALVGGRDVRNPGFNRALDAARPVGSLIKPAIYLTALENYKHYHLGSLIDDSPIQIKSNNKPWSPQNYDHKSHGHVTLMEALAHSYNQAATRLGMDVGLTKVLDTVKRLGVERELPPYPAILLGGTDLTLIEVSTFYQTIASDGFNTPLRAILEVLDANNQALGRYPLTVGQRFEPQAIALLTEALKRVMREGTGQGAYTVLPRTIDVAGKTGTTNGMRDSWFAGFSEDYLTVVWLGRDDNAPTPLTGASGALRVWTDIMSRMPIHSLQSYQGDDIRRVWYDPYSGLRTGNGCPGAVYIPMHIASIPNQSTDCRGVQNKPLLDKIRTWFH